MRESILRLFERTFGSPPEFIERVAADGSRREYHRLHGGPRVSVIGAFGPDLEENRAFLSFTRTFRELGLPVPELYAVDESEGIWLLEDLGGLTLFSALSAARREDPASVPSSVLFSYKLALEALVRFQIEGGRAIDFSVAHPWGAFDERSMRWDLNYFKYQFLRLSGIAVHEGRLEADFDRLVAFLLEADRTHFLYRDFQSRNILLRDGDPWFVDYQGGRRGALQYDLASLLYDGRAALPGNVREALFDHYLSALADVVPVERELFEAHFRGYVLVRIMQALGAYGQRGLFERKPLFLESIPYAGRNLALLIDAGLPVRLPELESAFRQIAERWPLPASQDPGRGLTVQISSFSYRAGLPREGGPHGGGFVFDCRSLPNPGRSPDYAELTGLDPAVASFLEACPEVEAFWTRISPLVEAHVENYRRRGFTDLAVAFGCTGGQHRSVYFAERLSRHLTGRFPDLSARVTHQEADRWPEKPWTP
jgi:aminoglycoside/choline kinase family phosphotransferase